MTNAMDDRKTNSVGELLTVSLLYLLATVIMTYPIAFHPGAHYSIHTDYFQGLWNIWWFKESLFELGRNPYFTEYLFYPTGVSLAFHTLSITNAFLALPFFSLLDGVSALNIVYLLTFLLSGVGGYLLVHDVTGSRKAAFLSGLVFAYCPYHYAKSYQIWEASIEWIPLFACFFLRFLRGSGVRDAMLAALMLFLASLSSWYLMVFLFLFIAITLVYFLVAHRDRILTAEFTKGFLAMVGLFGILILPFAYPMLREVIVGKSHMYTSLYAQFVDRSGALAGRRTDSTFQIGVTQLFGLRGATPVFWPGILGYITLLLAFYGALKGEMREKGLWIASAVIFFVFALGPFLTVFDRVYENIPMPWTVKDWIPVFRAIRYPHRFLAPLMMSLSVLAGGGALALARSLGRRGKSRRPGTLLIPALSVLVLVEFFDAPMKDFEAPMSPFYSTITPGEGAILEVPIMGPFTPTYMYFQRVHKRKLLGGQIAHAKEEVIDFLKVTPVVRELANPVLIEGRREAEFDLPENAEEILRSLGIQYVLLHTDILRPCTEANPIPRQERRWRLASLLPASLNPQRNRFQEALYFSMRQRAAFEEDSSLDMLQRALTDRLGPPIYEDDILVAFEVGPRSSANPEDEHRGDLTEKRSP